MPANARRIELYDTTLRDGAQGEGIAFSLVDKINIAHKLDALGFDFIEGGYPLSNPKDAAFFEHAAAASFAHARICAFGMTRRRGVEAAADAGMKALIDSKSPVITIVGKSWDLHVDEVLRVSRDENLAMIRESVAACRAAGREVIYDAEHYFDGLSQNPEYALQTLRAALDGGAGRLVLCDTNGGSLPDQIARAVTETAAALDGFAHLGIHTHNDCGLGVANSLAAIDAGVNHVQGTINGIGERCGNVDLIAVAANLLLKTDHDCLLPQAAGRLTELSRYVYELANMNFVPGQPFVGPSAFAHKGGMHVHAVQRVARAYEHVSPDQVGNSRRVLISELSGASNIAAAVGRKFNIEDDKEIQRQVLERVQQLEHQGYQFEAATASFELILHEIRGTRPTFWQLDHYRAVIYRRGDDASITEATVKLEVNDSDEHQVAEGDGPVNALDGALRRCLRPHYPQLDRLHLRDYKVRVVNPTAESAAKVRVTATFAVTHDAPPPGPAESTTSPAGETSEYFTTIGVNENIVDASWQAIVDAFTYHLIESA